MGIFDFLRTNKTEDNFGISLDIGTEFVKAIIFKVKEGKAYIHGVGRARQSLSDMQAGQVTDIQGVIENCRAALAQASKDLNFLPNQVIIGIAGELVKGTTTTVRYTRKDANKKIFLPELREIITNIQRKAFDAARKTLAWETGREEIDVRLVNAAIVKVEIDGYKVTNPLGFSGKNVEVGIFNAFAPVVHLGALQTIAEGLDLDLLAIVAEPYAVAKSVSEEEAGEFSAIIIDVGGGTTDIALVRQGGVEGTGMFAIGGRAFTKRVGDVIGVPFTQAEELKLKYSNGQLAEDDARLIQKAFMIDIEVWRSGVELTLADFSKEEPLPSKILLCGGGSALPEIKKALSAEEWSKKLAFAKKPQVSFIKPENIQGIVEETKSLGDPGDVTPLALANLAIELVGKEAIMSAILGKITQAIKT